MSDLLAKAKRQLARIDDPQLEVFASEGLEATAVVLAARAHGAWRWLADILLNGRQVDEVVRVYGSPPDIGLPVSSPSLTRWPTTSTSSTTPAQ